MNDSQSSNCCADACSMSFVSMDIDTYDSLVSNTKKALSSDDYKELPGATFFNTLVENCCSCVSQSFCFITELLSETEVCIEKLIKHLSDAISLLQKLVDFMKTAIESMVLTCCNVKAFPTSMGVIILTVITHCNESESLYGRNLDDVAKELKKLFRTCQELQLFYLMRMEKHFVFDLTNLEEKEILVNAIVINTRIGKIAQSVDAKTLAVQWKAITAICEKYSAVLSDTAVFDDCMQAVSSVLKSNIQSVIERDNTTNVMRSLKVAHFMFKVLQQACETFRHATRKDFTSLLNLLFYINETRFFNLETDKSEYSNSVVTPSEQLLTLLLSDEIFANSLLNCDFNKLKQEGTFLGFVLTIVFVMEYSMQGHISKTVTKSKLIDCLYSFLPHCDFSNIDLTINLDSNLKSHGLFEHLLIHTASMAFTLSGEEYSHLERSMFEAILDTDCASALFSANLWIMLLSAKHINPHLQFNQMVWLCTMYKKLEKHGMFHRSPQKLHLGYVINGLFDLMENDDKMKICKQYRIHDDNNLALWTALRVNSLPGEAQRAAEDVVIEKLKTQFQHIHSCKEEDIEKLTKVMSLAATCNLANARGIENFIIKAWSKTCPVVIKDIDAGTVWLYDYLQALLSLTDSVWDQVCSKNVNLIKILHCVTKLCQQSGVEFKLLLLNMLCKLATYDYGSKVMTDNFTEAFTCLSQDSCDIVQNKLFITLKQYSHDNNIDRLLTSVQDYTLREMWSKIKHARDYDSKDDVRDNVKYTHKCFESRSRGVSKSSSDVSELNKVSSGNFEFTNIVEDEFKNYSESDFGPPVSKKVKLDSGETEAIVKRLENDATLLCKMKENVFTNEYRSRIRNVCDKLKNIIH